MFSSFTLKIKNLEHDTIRNRTLQSADNSVLYFGECRLRQKEDGERNWKVKEKTEVQETDTRVQAEREREKGQSLLSSGNRKGERGVRFPSQLLTF